MTVDVTPTRASGVLPPSWATLRLAAAVLAYGGVLPTAAARAVMGPCKRPMQQIGQALQPLLELGVVVQREATWYAPSMGDLAAWIADGYDAREDAGIHVDPLIPAQRRAA